MPAKMVRDEHDDDQRDRPPEADGFGIPGGFVRCIRGRVGGAEAHNGAECGDEGGEQHGGSGGGQPAEER